MANVEWMTYQSVASNYKKESDGIVPVREEYTLGPFYHNMSLSVPRHILTKTHCDGFCDDCSMQTSYMNLSGFEAGCGRSERIRVKGVITNPPYPSSVPKKVVHLIRSPWDNIVSRMHHGIFRRRTYLNWTEEQLAPFQNSREGVMSWCQYVDRGFWDARALNTSGLSVDDLQAITSVPCGPDFFRYVQWHNNAVVLMQKMGVPMHRIYYEDYTAQFNKTTQDLLDFLELRAVNPPVPFKTGKTYDHLMDIRDRRKAWDLIQRFATPELREVLSRYESGVDLASEGAIEQASRRFLRRA
jgi:Sulfotransferase domain